MWKVQGKWQIRERGHCNDEGINRLVEEWRAANNRVVEVNCGNRPKWIVSSLGNNPILPKEAYNRLFFQQGFDGRRGNRCWDGLHLEHRWWWSGFESLPPSPSVSIRILMGNRHKDSRRDRVVQWGFVGQGDHRLLLCCLPLDQECWATGFSPVDNFHSLVRGIPDKWGNDNRNRCRRSKTCRWSRWVRWSWGCEPAQEREAMGVIVMGATLWCECGAWGAWCNF